ncbi:MAG: AAA family ATPase [Candidatus Binataceae bacterium]
MKLKQLQAHRFKSLRELTLPLRDLNLLIGANAAGKSNVLDALKFLSEAVENRDFTPAIFSRGNIVQLAWKGEAANGIQLETLFEDGAQEFKWSVQALRQGRDFLIEESLHRMSTGALPQMLLTANSGRGFWYTEDGQKFPLKMDPTKCALAAAAPNEAFPGAAVARFVLGWMFCDPSPSYLRMPTPAQNEGVMFDSWGRNLAGRLLELQNNAPQVFARISRAVRDILGVPESIEAKSTQEGEIFLLQREAGLAFRIHQKGASTGTLRMLALMTALLGNTEANLIGIEEPENYIHPGALQAFAQYLREAAEQVQILVTTHSPLLLNYLDSPEAVCVVRRTPDGTKVEREHNPDAVRKALEESGFGLGDLLETKGFGA